MAQLGTETYQFGSFHLHVSEHLLLHRGKALPLTPKAFLTLVVLVRNAGRLVRKDDLLREVWPDTIVEESGLTRNISVLRKLLGEGVEDQKYIETIPKVGYRFVAPVRTLNAPQEGIELVLEKRTRATIVAEEEIETDVPEVRYVKVLPAISSPPVRDVRRLRRLVLATSFLGITAAGVVFAFNLAGARDYFLRPAVGPLRSIAVLPLENLTGDPQQESLAGGLSEVLLTELAKQRDLRVVSRVSSQQYKVGEKRPREIARELGVDGVVQGALLRTGDFVEVTIQLVDARADRNLWAERYRQTRNDLSAWPSLVATAIGREVGLKAAAPAIGGSTIRRPVDPEAYRLYLTGRYLWNLRSAAPPGRSARSYLEAAVAREPAFAPAHATLAASYAVTLDRLLAREHAARAIELDESLSDAHAALGFVQMYIEWNWKAAGESFRRAVTLSPNDAMAHQWYSQYLAAIGRLPEAVAEMERALENDPFSLIINADLCQVYYFAGRYEDAERQCRHTLEMDPAHEWAKIYLHYVYARTQRHRESLEIIGIRPARYAPADLDGRALYLRVAADVEKNLHDTPDSWNRIAEYYAVGGDRQRALEWLERAVRTQNFFMAYLKVNPLFEELRADPRFQELVRKTGLEPAF